MDPWIIDYISKCIDVVGVFIIVFGMLFVSIAYFHLWVRGKGRIPDLDKPYRQSLERVILVGLEFLVAGDIIHSIAVTPTISSMAVLGLIIAIRTVLSIELNMEIEGRWPWQRARETSSKK